MREKNRITLAVLSGLVLVLALVTQVGCQSLSDAERVLGAIATQQSRSLAPATAQAAGWGYTVTVPLISQRFDPTYSNPFGVVMYSGVDDATGVQTMRQAGAKSATTILYWAAIQPDPQVAPDWSAFDPTAHNAQAAGMDLFVLFNGNPTWAAEYPGGPVTDTQHLVNFVTAMVERYDCDGLSDAPGNPCIRYWSFYAEPDNGDLAQAAHGKGLWGDDGARYAEMLTFLSPAIHEADPQAKVLIGGLAYDHFEPNGPFVQSFLDTTLGALSTKPGGVAAYLDAVAFHYYPISPVWASIREKAAEIRGIMAAHGAGNLPLLSPEMGYWSSANHGSTEQRQASWLVQNYVKGLSADIRLLSWYKVFDDPVAAGETEWPDDTAGLLRVDGTPKLSYHAYRTMTRELAQAHYARPYQAAGVEGHVFAPAAGKEKIVLWSLGGTARVTFPYDHLRLVTMTGDPEYDIWDNQSPAGAPGDLDGGIAGQIAVELLADQPVYVERK